jgi:UDP-glucose 4-epimerase
MTQKISQKGDILITGGSGFIGNYVVDLLKKKYDLVVIDLVDPKIPGTKFQKIDLRKPFKINSDFKTCIHLAAFVGGIQFFTKHPVENIRDNPKMTGNIFDACVDSGIDHVIYTSSSVVYQYQKKFPTKETAVESSPTPSSAYGLSKLVGEYFCKSYNEQFGINYTVLRPFNAYGPGEAPDPDYAHVIPHLIKKTVSNQYPVEIYGSGKQSRTFTYGTDIAKAFELSVSKKSAQNEIFNVSGDVEYQIHDVLKLIWKLTKQKRQLKIKHLKPLKDDVQRRFPSNKKLKDTLGWKPKISFEKGLSNTIDWIQQNS